MPVVGFLIACDILDPGRRKHAFGAGNVRRACRCAPERRRPGPGPRAAGLPASRRMARAEGSRSAARSRPSLAPLRNQIGCELIVCRRMRRPTPDCRQQRRRCAVRLQQRRQAPRCKPSADVSLATLRPHKLPHLVPIPTTMLALPCITICKPASGDESWQRSVRLTSCRRLAGPASLCAPCLRRSSAHRRGSKREQRN